MRLPVFTLQFAGSGLFRWRKQLQANLPTGGLAGLQSDHAGIHTLPLLTKGIAEVVLLFHGDERLFLRRIDLDGLDLWGKSLNVDAVGCRRVCHIHNDLALGALEMGEIVVEKLVVKRLSGWRVEVIGSSFDWDQLAGGEDVVVIVDLRIDVSRDVQMRLLTVSAGEIEVGVPSNAHRFRVVAHILGGDGCLEAVLFEADDDGQVFDSQ
jgi:hypothetical protein